MEVFKKDADKFQAGDAFFDVAVLRSHAKDVPESSLSCNLRPKAIIMYLAIPMPRNDLREAQKHGYTLPHQGF